MSLRKIGFFEGDEAPERIALPDELVIKFLSSLSFKDLVNVQHICKQFALLSRDEKLWERLCKEHFHVDITGPDCMQKFILHYSCAQAIEYPAPEFKPEVPRTAPVEFRNEEFRAFNRKYDEIKKNFIVARYKKLREFIKNDLLKKDTNWTTCLEGRFFLHCTAFFKNPRETVLRRAKILLSDAAKNGHPLAMLELARSFGLGLTDEEKHDWVVKASKYKSPEIAFRVASFYFHD